MRTIQLVRPHSLVKSIDASVDIDLIMKSDLEEHLRDCYAEMSPKFKSHINRNGIQRPVEVGISRHRDRRFYLGNGHHRLAIAWVDKHPWVPVFFRTVRGLEDFIQWRCAHPDTWDSSLINHEGKLFIKPAGY